MRGRGLIPGRKRAPRPQTKGLDGLAFADEFLRTELGLVSTGTAALTFRPGPSSDETVGPMPSVTRTTDAFGFEWLVVRELDIQALVSAIKDAVKAVTTHDPEAGLLTAAFRFDGGEHPVYLVYGLNGGAFWPFVPAGEKPNRDNARELELKEKLERALPIEKDITRWFGLFDAPL